VTIGWGDVSTAYYSTGIPNIETYFAFPNTHINVLKFMRLAGPLLYNRPVKDFLKFLVDTFAEPGPNDEKRRKGRAILVGEVTGRGGEKAFSKLTTPEGYTCTALTAVAIMERILSGEWKPGFQTASMAYGPDFILQFEGVTREDLP
jgi:short subunit dehydrogenase-like uncharacterized protein